MVLRSHRWWGATARLACCLTAGTKPHKERADWCQVINGPEPKQGGPGTILKDLMSAFRIRACWGCLDLAGKMDTWGPDGCEENFQYIVDAMEANAQQRKWYRFIPFAEMGIAAIVRAAIAQSRASQT